jgi:drug/metabolite transporter (DMT)-like permease
VADGEAETIGAPAPAAVPVETHLPVAGIVLVGLLALIWGLNWPAMRAAVVEISPWSFRAICLTVAAIVLFAISFAGGGHVRVPRREIGPLMLVAFLNVTAWHLLTAFGLSMMESTRGILLGFTFPVWSVLIGTIALRERLTVGRAAALVLGIGAMAILLGPEVTRVGGAPLGGILLIGAAIVWALATVTLKLFRWTLAARELAAWQVLIGGAPVVVGALFFGSWAGFDTLSVKAVIGLVYSSLIAASIGQWVWFQILRLMPAGVASISTLAIPVVGVFTGGLLLGEPVGWRELTALALVLGALSIVLVGGRGLDALRRVRAR